MESRLKQASEQTEYLFYPSNNLKRIKSLDKLAIFGSVLGDKFCPDSDVDILIEFDPEHIPDLEFFIMQEELSQITEHPVDVNTSQFLSPSFRDKVQQDSKVLYERT
ncbi:MAG TPA: nucleotidyltransferase [Spirochaetes bacterium]|nr:nucleotidyltransferase [Spirochaetota bacterium]